MSQTATQISLKQQCKQQSKASRSTHPDPLMRCQALTSGFRFKAWSAISGFERGKILSTAAKILYDNHPELARKRVQNSTAFSGKARTDRARLSNA
eukprot:1433088-Rhodomonas_salina.2